MTHTNTHTKTHVLASALKPEAVAFVRLLARLAVDDYLAEKSEQTASTKGNQNDEEEKQ